MIVATGKMAKVLEQGAGWDLTLCEVELTVMGPRSIKDPYLNLKSFIAPGASRIAFKSLYL